MIRSIDEIWSGVLKGNTSAWRELVDLYAGLVFTVARRAGLSTADSEDCAQQVWISLYKRRRMIRDPVALPAWLVRSTHRRAIGMKMRTYRQEEIAATSEIAPQKLPDEVVNALEESALIEIAMGQLDTRCRELLRELYFKSDEKSYKQIAHELRISPNSLGPLRSRCLSRLKKILEKLGRRMD